MMAGKGFSPANALGIDLVEVFEEAVREAEKDCHFATVPRWVASCSEREEARAKLLAFIEGLAAQAIEARRAATGTGAVEDESAVAESDAP